MGPDEVASCYLAKGTLFGCGRSGGSLVRRDAAPTPLPALRTICICRTSSTTCRAKYQPSSVTYHLSPGYRGTRLPCALFDRLVAANEDGDTYFACLAALHKARLKYEKILCTQPMPTLNHVGPRGLLQYGKLVGESLADSCSGENGSSTLTDLRRPGDGVFIPANNRIRHRRDTCSVNKSPVAARQRSSQRPTGRLSSGKEGLRIEDQGDNRGIGTRSMAGGTRFSAGLPL